jgi:hypothetical protein
MSLSSRIFAISDFVFCHPNQCFVFHKHVLSGGTEQSSNMQLVFASTAILGFGTHGHIFILSKTPALKWGLLLGERRG